MIYWREPPNIINVCPKCKSMRLKIVDAVGLERIKAFVTSQRQYHCLDCANVFRIPDRRKTARGAADVRSAAWDSKK